MVNELVQIEIVNSEGQRKDQVEFDVGSLDVFKANRRISDVTVMLLANQKKHTSKVKSRSEVLYTNRKPRKQKGSGMARAGSARSPIWVGGGVAHGPKPRDVRYEIPRKLKLKTLKDSLYLKVKNRQVVILEPVQMDAPKTKTFVALLKKLELSGAVLFVTEQNDPNFLLSIRNIPRVRAELAANLNALDVVGAGHLVFCNRAAFDKVVAKLGAGKGAGHE